jgi:hypothetical protein
MNQFVPILQGLLTPLLSRAHLRTSEKSDLPTAALGQDHPQKRVGVLMPFPKEDETIQEELAAFA